MKRTSVMIDVSDEVHNKLVEPHKRQKTFSKLIVALLQGYIDDPYIRSAVDDSLDDGRRVVIGSFEDSIQDMEASLAKMGVLADSLQANTQAGYSKFTSRAGEQAESINKGNSASNTVSPEVSALEKRVQSIEQTMQEGISQIVRMLSGSGYPVAQPAMGFGYAPMYPAVNPAVLAQMGYAVVDPNAVAPNGVQQVATKPVQVEPKPITPVGTVVKEAPVEDKVVVKPVVQSASKPVDEPVIRDMLAPDDSDYEDSSGVGVFLDSLIGSFGDAL